MGLDPPPVALLAPRAPAQRITVYSVDLDSVDDCPPQRGLGLLARGCGCVVAGVVGAVAVGLSPGGGTICVAFGIARSPIGGRDPRAW